MSTRKVTTNLHMSTKNTVTTTLRNGHFHWSDWEDNHCDTRKYKCITEVYWQFITTNLLTVHYDKHVDGTLRQWRSQKQSMHNVTKKHRSKYSPNATLQLAQQYVTLQQSHNGTICRQACHDKSAHVNKKAPSQELFEIDTSTEQTEKRSASLTRTDECIT